MLVPTGTVHQARAAGAAIKEVACQHCGGRFFYVLRRVGRGRASAPLFIGTQRAEQEAVAAAGADLDQALAHESDPVPCLYCGRYQPEMIRLAKNRRLNFGWGCGGAVVAFLLPLLFALALLDEKGQESAGYVSYAAAVVVFLGFCVLRWRYDPNWDPASRLGPRAGVQAERFDSLKKAEAVLLQRATPAS
jgi:hypothetical protein